MGLDEEYEAYLIECALCAVEFSADENLVDSALEYLKIMAPKELAELHTKMSVDEYWETKAL